MTIIIDTESLLFVSTRTTVITIVVLLARQQKDYVEYASHWFESVRLIVLFLFLHVCM